MTKSSRSKMFFKFLKISQNAQENICVGISFLIVSLKKRFGHRFFPVKFATVLRAAFLRTTPVAAFVL